MLDLCVVLLGFRIMKSILKSQQQLSITIDSIHGWTDSPIVYRWLSRQPSH